MNLKMGMITMALILSGCATPSQENQAKTVINTFCSNVTTFNTFIATLPNLNPILTNQLDVAKPIVEAVCNDPDTLDPTTLQNLLKTGFPLLLNVIMALPADPTVKLIETNIQIAEVVIPVLIDSLPQK